MRVSTKSLRGFRTWAPWIATVLASCGSRTQFTAVEGPPPPPECISDKDCDGFGDQCFPVACVAGSCKDLTPVDCDDQNPCTTDTCDSSSGKCSHGSAVLDLDGDGHFAPLPGKKPGEPGSCGDDCDDTNAAAHPGGVEVCDGVDNDCDGIVDNGASLVAVGDAVLVSDQNSQASPASIAYGGGSDYLTAFSGELGSNASVYLAELDRNGKHDTPQKFLAVPADGYGGPLAWTGDRYGIAWSDRREARGGIINYEVYFNIVNPDGTKRNADLRLSFADGFSISPALAWTGNEFVVLWQDDGTSRFGFNELVGQRIDVNGAAIGGNVQLIDDGGLGQTSPAIAAGKRTLGVAWMSGDATSHQLMFAVFDQELHPMMAPALITARMTSGVYPIIVFNQSTYIVAWHDPDSALKTVYGTVRDELGGEIVAAKPIAKTTGHARYPAILPYGDRSLFVWADDRDNNQGYELYATTLDNKLDPIASETRLTTAPGDSIDPVLSFGPSGEVGVVFGDNRTMHDQVYFTHLQCVTGPRPP
jgi:hypothetical protein